MRKEVLNLLNNINKKFGVNAVRPASEVEDSVITRIPTGSVSLDIALGGGVPVGRLVQFAGVYSACKSAIAYHIAKNAQKFLGKKQIPARNESKRWIICSSSDKDATPLTVALIQSETHSYSNDWAESIGIETDNLIFVQPESMEEA